MAGANNIIKLDLFLLRHVFIKAPPKDPVMQNATSKNKLNLSGVWVEWLLIQDLKPILQSSKCPFNSYSKAGVSEIKQLLCSPRKVPTRELVEMVPCFLKGGRIPDGHA